MTRQPDDMNHCSFASDSFPSSMAGQVPTTTTFGQTIRQLRKERRLTQRALAKEVGINFTYLSKIENNRLEPGQSPKKETIAKLAEALQTDSDELLLLARKIPDSIARQIMERPNLFRRIACLDDETIEQVLQGLDERKVNETLDVLNESRCFLHQVLDSQPHHVAVLDQNGVIIVVNRAWRQFAIAGGLEEHLCTPGTDYFSIYQRAMGLSDDDAGAATRAIHEVLSGTRETLEQEYRSTTPSGERPILLRVNRFLQGNVPRVVISHDIMSSR